MKYSRMGGLIEVFFDDLTDEAKRIFLEAMGLDNEQEGNYDIYPIVVIPIPEEQEGVT